MTAAIAPPPSRPSAPSEAPQRLTDLTQAEHLLVWSLRATASGHGDCPALAQTFERVCGASGMGALQAQFILVKLLGVGARRVLRVHAPGCPCVGLDETAVVGLAAAAQQALRDGDDGLLRLRVGSLARPDYAEGLRRIALGLAEALGEAGIRLPLRLDGIARPAGRPYALH